jgi:hypothetical protein
MCLAHFPEHKGLVNCTWHLCHPAGDVVSAGAPHLLGCPASDVPARPAAHPQPCTARQARGMAWQARAVGGAADVPREAAAAAETAGAHCTEQGMLQVRTDDTIGRTLGTDGTIGRTLGTDDTISRTLSSRKVPLHCCGSWGSLARAGCASGRYQYRLWQQTVVGKATTMLWP